MINTRLELQSKLEEILGSRNVYFQPPTNLVMRYPCIRYTRSKINSVKADNKKYLKNVSYELTLISINPEEDHIISQIEDLDYCEHGRHYISDNLHHDIFTITTNFIGG